LWKIFPFHNGHKAVIDKALEHANEVVIVVGSSFQARSTKNPFTFSERREMIKAVYPQDSVKVVGVIDYPYDDNAWVSAVQSAVDNVKSGEKTGLIGHSKDHSSYYLKIFPKWRNHIEVDNVDGINATDIREYLFGGTDKGEYSSYPTESMSVQSRKVMTNIILNNSKIGQFWDNLYQEYNEIKNYREKSQMVGFNFPSVFVTTDAVLTQSGYILLIKRGNFPFKGYWALPGGYLDKGKFIVDNMIKELHEETCVKVPPKVLKGSIKGVHIFDHPDRDPRGRVITHGFHIDLGYPDEKLPKVKGADDAVEAKWFHLSEVTSEMMAFDHYSIIKHFVKT
jgi:bifunctional NMN adenylyltransferase/nudix hydrolase